jgi:hypothetical protein
MRQREDERRAEKLRQIRRLMADGWSMVRSAKPEKRAARFTRHREGP